MLGVVATSFHKPKHKQIITSVVSIGKKFTTFNQIIGTKQNKNAFYAL